MTLKDWFENEDNRPTIRKKYTGSSIGEPNILNYIDKPEKLIEHLLTEIPYSYPVIVVDGSLGNFSIELCRFAKTLTSPIFWIVNTCNEPSNEKDFHHLNPLIQKDILFMDNIVPDLVILSANPTDTIHMRFSRWSSHSRYILLEKFIQLDFSNGCRRVFYTDNE